jgi:heme-degrading monooxygenase HmoA
MQYSRGGGAMNSCFTRASMREHRSPDWRIPHQIQGGAFMIVRVWRGRAPSSNPLAYGEHFRRRVLPELERIEGFLGASLLRQIGSDDVEFLVLTRWASMDAIRAFAGDDVERAVIEPDAIAALVSFDRTVRHYEVVQETTR